MPGPSTGRATRVWEFDLPRAGAWTVTWQRASRLEHVVRVAADLVEAGVGRSRQQLDPGQVVVQVKVLGATWESILEIETAAFKTRRPRDVLRTLIAADGSLLSILCTTTWGVLFASLTEKYNDAVARLEADRSIFEHLVTKDNFLNWACRDPRERRALERLLRSRMKDPAPDIRDEVSEEEAMDPVEPRHHTDDEQDEMDLLTHADEGDER